MNGRTARLIRKYAVKHNRDLRALKRNWRRTRRAQRQALRLELEEELAP